MVVPVDSEVYYRGVFWNTHRQVESHLNQLAFDHPYGSWTQFVRYEHGGPYRMALSLNCGVGWVERALIENGAVDRIVAVDYMSDLLRTARVNSLDLADTTPRRLSRPASPRRQRNRRRTRSRCAGHGSELPCSPVRWR